VNENTRFAALIWIVAPLISTLSPMVREGRKPVAVPSQAPLRRPRVLEREGEPWFGQRYRVRLSSAVLAVPSQALLRRPRVLEREGEPWFGQNGGGEPDSVRANGLTVNWDV